MAKRLYILEKKNSNFNSKHFLKKYKDKNENIEMSKEIKN